MDQRVFGNTLLHLRRFIDEKFTLAPLSSQPVNLKFWKLRLPPLNRLPSMPRLQLRRRRICSRQHNHGRADRHAAVKILDVLIGLANAAGGHEAADAHIRR